MTHRKAFCDICCQNDLLLPVTFVSSISKQGRAPSIMFPDRERERVRVGSGEAAHSRSSCSPILTLSPIPRSKQTHVLTVNQSQAPSQRHTQSAAKYLVSVRFKHNLSEYKIAKHALTSAHVTERLTLQKAAKAPQILTESD